MVSVAKILPTVACVLASVFNTVKSTKVRRVLQGTLQEKLEVREQGG